jgi:hypothetical protein
LSHPWSGVVEVAVGGKNTDVDLYDLLTTMRPSIMSFDATDDRDIVIRPLGRKNEASNGYEVWVQRIWLLTD